MSEPREMYLARINATTAPTLRAGDSRALRTAGKAKPLSHVGDRSAGTLACPRCGGTQFRVHRTKTTKLTFGLLSLLRPAHHVRCATCGTDYRRA